ncbi:hypothetical protein TIFTF001_051873 [Ficus carica]|uniref:Uncharacterized protein n=1 Tax=Ficus carica TaxID=3494 RepID=A0AA88EES3_FICCA|nr:hypothetical protein TIFTF001_051873 [Ficus carica]
MAAADESEIKWVASLRSWHAGGAGCRRGARCRASVGSWVQAWSREVVLLGLGPL